MLMRFLYWLGESFALARFDSMLGTSFLQK
jgi:hypothetical protein